ncbi:LOW QUALITY PROTEIN: huntingtin-associated protein 1 [Pteronotus mesoamericanus]|uniref:LOW QUALITY PROTEIN: huntingtin-associated protein 1 n=1 Tax=Pteronotus mesoamericanus TaxID=1884717 RepID=UPI0023EADD53|nr:LOW QUALITY PROTEIN: huntingtin-associated protein 1 [Pteronotus parnellii mesoamericanus]
MRPKESGQGSAGDGPGDSPATTPAPPPAASPAPEPSAEPEPAPERAPAAGQGEGSGSPSVSGPPGGACPASEVGSEAGAQGASAFSPVQENAESVPSNSDAPGTRVKSQGPLDPQATGLGTGKAAEIWKTPAAYFGRWSGVSSPERATFIRELEEALCSDQPLSDKITREDVKVMLNVLQECLPPVWESQKPGIYFPWMAPLQRERDLNTAARIGQSLVKQNSDLMEENSKLEAMLGSAREEILHLRHQVSLRDDLLQLYSDSDDEEEEEDKEEEEEEEREEEKKKKEEPQHNHPYEAPELTPAAESEPQHHCPQLEALQEQLRLLEEENEQLREEASQLDVLEEEEMLILECVEQFAEASQQMAELSEVLVFRMDNYDRQHKEVIQLRAQVTSLQQCCQSLQDLREKYVECGGTLTEDQEDAKTFRQQIPEPTGPVTHYTYTIPLEAIPEFQASLAETLRRCMRNMAPKPDFIMERNYGMKSEETLNLSEEQESESEEGSMTEEDFMPMEELGATEEVVPAEEGPTEEAWEEVEPELDEATRKNVVTSALEARSLGPSHLDAKYVLQQLASWQDAGYKQQQPRQKTLQKGECSHGGLPPASRTSCRTSSR